MTIRKFRIKIDEKTYEAEVEEIGGNTVTAPAPPINSSSPFPQPVAVSGPGNAVIAPMPGKIISFKVSRGQQVNVGDVVLILEAMKMEQEIKTATGGTVLDILVKAGDTVKKEQSLIMIG